MLREEQLPNEEAVRDRRARPQRRGDGSASTCRTASEWIERANANDFRVSQLPHGNGLLRSDWDGQLRQKAGSSSPVEPLPLEWRAHIARQIGVEVIGTTRVDNEDWIHVQFELERCGSDSVRQLAPVHGWVPAHRANGMPTVWFYSRGC